MSCNFCVDAIHCLFPNYVYFTIICLFVEISWFENYNTHNIITPVNAEMLDTMLKEANCDTKKREFLVNSFKRGFSLNFNGNRRVKRIAPNLKLRVGSLTEMWNKVMKEVQAGRYAGPFAEPPFEHFIQSPIGLVPKDQGKKTRLIFHLLYPRGTCTSVNDGIPEEKCSVKYPEFEHAVHMCTSLDSELIYIGKSDMSMAFRHMPLSPLDYSILVLKCEHPKTKKIWWFLDKCLPFRSSISCAIFQAISDSITYLVSFRTKRPTLNYLDDYFFSEVLKRLCDWQVNQFLWVCDQINFPVSLEKTYWGSQFLVFLGFLIDTINRKVGIPIEKLVKALTLIEEMMSSRKTTVHKVQKLCGVLNFLCRVITPGRAFTRRLYSLTASKTGVPLKQYHHVRVRMEDKLDLGVWKMFLTQHQVYCKSFEDFGNPSILDVPIYSDASRNFGTGGFGAWCQNSWLQSRWETPFMLKAQPSIEYLELFVVTVAVLAWIEHFKNQKIRLFCDNESVCFMINKSTANCRYCMILIRIIVLAGLKNNTQIFCKHVRTKQNGRADALSRSQFKTFLASFPTKHRLHTNKGYRMKYGLWIKFILLTSSQLF